MGGHRSGGDGERYGETDLAHAGPRVKARPLARTHARATGGGPEGRDWRRDLDERGERWDELSAIAHSAERSTRTSGIAGDLNTMAQRRCFSRWMAMPSAGRRAVAETVATGDGERVRTFGGGAQHRAEAWAGRDNQGEPERRRHIAPGREARRTRRSDGQGRDRGRIAASANRRPRAAASRTRSVNARHGARSNENGQSLA